ncbi:hypothetical protein M9H77_29397 [Catharanthus roseus]|uniref:Uncharacterized protein n=1 Tax=Catharanthus roseus TaxID=4058 RepID=A0ACB9ZU98_CATRO|nr:hypothetical protein M9H77_29397 [Catharanthus roseus]
MELINLYIESQIERYHGYLIKMPQNFHDRSYPIDVVFMLVQNANHSIRSYGNEKQEILFLEIRTKESLTPNEALHETSRNLIDLFILFLHMEEENSHLENKLPPGSTTTSKGPIILDLLNNSQEDLMKMEHFRIEDMKIDFESLVQFIYSREIRNLIE